MAKNSDSMLLRWLIIGLASADGAFAFAGSAFAKMRGGGSPSELGRPGADPENWNLTEDVALRPCRPSRPKPARAKEVLGPSWGDCEALGHRDAGHAKPLAHGDLSRFRGHEPKPAPKPVWHGSLARVVYGASFSTAISLESTLPLTGGIREGLGCRC